MSNMQKYLQKILSERFGKDVRQAIHDGMKENYDIAVGSQSSAYASAQTAIQKASEAVKASEKADTKAAEALASAAEAKTYYENAAAVTGVVIADQITAGIMKGGENYVAEDGTLQLTAQTTDSILKNSYAGSIKINEVLGNCEQTQYTGKNLFDLSTFTITNTSVTIDEVDLETGYAKVTFENAATQGAAYSTKFSLVDSETYIFSANAIIQDRGITIAIQVVEAEAGTWVTNYKAGVSFTASSEYTYRFIIQNNTGAKYSGTVEVDSIQLELGSVATDYEPYVGGIPSPNPDYPQEIQSVEVSEIKAHGKNLIPFPYYDTSKTKDGIEWVVYDDGKVEATGTATKDATFYFSTNFKLKAGSYKLSGCPSGGSNSSYRIQIADNSWANGFVDIGNGALITLETEMLLPQFRILIPNGTKVTNLVFEPMIRKADVDDDAYEPYQESVVTLSEAVTLHGINDVRDRIVRKDGALCIERNLAEVVLDGSEEWTLGSVDNLFRTTVVAGISPKAITAMLSDSYICSMQSVANMPDKTIRQSVNADLTTAVAHIKDSSYSTVEELTAALAANPVRCIVMRAEPTYESLPVADQIALNGLESFDTVTYLSTDSEIDAVINVEYGTSKVGAYLFEYGNKEENNAIKNAQLESAILSLGGNV